MSSGKQHAEREWRRTIAGLEARVEELKVRCDAEYRRLHDRLDTQVAELRGELRKLEEVEVSDSDANAQRVAAQLDELRAKGDAAYDLLRAKLKATGHNALRDND
jgi:hypothetical protein